VAVDNIPVPGATMGQVWKMLGGTPGQERRLTVKRAGKEFVVPAKVQHFLPALPDEDNKKKKK
jgi:C-terminal processing protease CtpA/Prc